MNSLFYLEDFVEFIAGYRDHNNIPKDFWNRTPSPINLARYDVHIIDSLAQQTNDYNRAYTTKQAKLAQKLVNKYSKQLKKLSIPILVPDNLQPRLGIRVVDQSKRVWIEDNIIRLKFPFQSSLIDEIRKLGKEGIGSAVFDQNTKVWELGLTEFMLNWAVAVGKANNFEIEPKALELFDKILETEKLDFDISLDINDSNKFFIANGANDLVEYIADNAGGFELDNLLNLCDMSSVLGITPTKKVRDLFAEKFNQSWSKYIFSRHLTVDKSDTVMDEILQYATVTNRLPVYVYDTSTPKKDTDQIIYLNSKRNIHQYKSIKKIKLMVSHTPVLIGVRKQSWINSAEKVIIIK